MWFCHLHSTKEVPYGLSRYMFNFILQSAIKKLIEMICNYTIHDIDMSRLDIRWICDVFAEQSGYSKSAFNIIGAYFFINSFSWVFSPMKNVNKLTVLPVRKLMDIMTITS